MSSADDALVHWQRQMRRFFLLELPGALLLAALAVMLRRSLPDDAPLYLHAITLIGCVSACIVVGYVWGCRLPPERPAVRTRSPRLVGETASD